MKLFYKLLGRRNGTQEKALWLYCYVSLLLTSNLSSPPIGQDLPPSPAYWFRTLSLINSLELETTPSLTKVVTEQTTFDFLKTSLQLATAAS